MVKIHVWNASIVKVQKDIKYYDFLYELLSFYNIYKDRTGRLQREKGSYFSKTHGVFGLGLLPYVESSLTRNEIEYQIFNIKKPIDLTVKENVKLHNITLEDYQQNIIEFMNPKLYRGIIEASTGSGKGIIAAGIIDRFNRPETLIFVPNKTILHGFHKELEKSLQENIGIVGDGIFQKEKITIGLYQSLRNYYKEFFKTNLIIVDESQSVNNSIYEMLTSMTETWYRFGLTGTSVSMADKKKWFQNTAQVGPVIKKVSDKQTAKRVTDVEAYMFKFKHITKKEDFQEIYHEVLHNRKRCRLIVKMAHFALYTKEKKSCLILVDEYKQAKIIQEIAQEEFDLNPEIAWSKHPNIVKLQDDLNEGRVDLVIATTVWSVGTNIPNLESLVLGSARKSYVNTIQKIGRVRRSMLNKTSSLLLDVYDEIYDKFENKKALTRFAEKRQNIYKIKGWFKGMKEL